MKALFPAALIGVCATLCACSDSDRAPSPFGPDLAAPAAGSELRIVSPADGALVTAPTLTVLAEQQAQGVPSQGRAQLQSSPDGESWSALGAEFAWSAQDETISTGAIVMSGAGTVWLRLVVYEQTPADPFLISDVSSIRCLARSAQVLHEPTT